MKMLRATVATIVTVLAVSAAAAQTGGMKVRVYDAKNNEPLIGATVTLSHATGNVKTTTESADADGYVIFPVLRAGGGYTIEVYFGGYQKVALANQRVRIGETITIPIGLSEDLVETIEVKGNREVVDFDKGTQTGAKFSDEFIQDLPVQGRFYQNVLTLAPGVTDSDGDGNPNVSGARQGDFKAVVGGVANVDPLTGDFLNFVNADSIEEIEVVTAGAGVDVGRAQGGYAKILQKQGTNEFEGRFQIIYRSSILDGNGATNLSGTRVPEFDSYQPSLRLSGPILKDRLWYFLAHEYQKLDNPVNTLNEVVVSTLTRPIIADKLTWQASPRNKLEFQFSNSPTTITNFGVTSARVEENAEQREFGGPEYKVTWTAPYSPKLLVESLVAYQDAETNILPMTSGIANDCVVSLGLPVFQESDCVNAQNGRRTGSYFLTHRDQRQRLTLKSDADLYGGRIWGANHQFQFGFSVENERYFQYEERGETSRFELDSDPTRPDSDPLETVGSLITRISVPRESTANVTGMTWGMYLSDTIKPLNNLTITAGVRFSREQLNSRGVSPFDPAAESARFVQETSPPPIGQSLPPRDRLVNDFTSYEGIQEFLNQVARTVGIPEDQIEGATSPFLRQSAFWAFSRTMAPIDIVNNNFEPNLALSWDPWSNGKTAFKISAARHYGLIPLNRPAIELRPARGSIRSIARGGNPDWIISTGCGPDAPPGCQPNDAFRNISPTVEIFTLDRNLQTPYQDEYAFKFERELTPEMAFKFTAIHRDFQDQHQDIDINHAPGDYGRCVLQFSESAPTLIPGTQTVDNPTGGDGIMDDCTGRFERAVAFPEPGDDGQTPGTTELIFLKRPDGYLDTYVLNPAWGSVFKVGNFNTQTYDGLVFQLQRRLYRGWQMDASYTWSQAKGDAEDFESELGDDQTNQEDERGFLSYDQTHVVKLNATTVTNSGIQIGGAIQWQSGLPYSLVEERGSVDAIPPQYAGFGVPNDPRTRLLYPTGQRNDQRNESFWNFDLRVAKDFNLAGGKTLGLSAEVFNLLNADPLRIFEVNNDRAAAVRDFGRRFQLGATFAF